MTIRERFVACARCGKERPVYPIREDDSDSLFEKWCELAALGLCRACEAEIGQALDACPETLRVPGGSSACSLGWKHEGRCVPYDMPDEQVMRQIRERRGA